MEVCVIGLGYIGLPTAAILAGEGHRVTGVDTDAGLLEEIRAIGARPEEPGLAELVKSVLADRRLVLSPEAVGSEAFILCLPTPLLEDKTADLSWVRSGMGSVLDVLKKGDLVVLESTVPPGTTAGLVADMVGRAGLDPLEDVDLAFAPERVIPGNILHELVSLDRVMGGLTRRAAERAKALYSTFVKGTIHLTDATTAEFVKLVENSYRDVNIAFANELALLAGRFGVNVWEVIDIANRHPRVNIHSPGPGVGGHCIAVDPYFIIEGAGGRARFLSLARETNSAMPDEVLRLAKAMLGELDGRSVAVLGLAYKANVGDSRESPAFRVIDLLEREGARCRVHDPFVTKASVQLFTLEDAVKGADLVVIVTGHTAFKELEPDRIGTLMNQKKVLDTRNVIDAASWRRAGWAVSTLGNGLVE